MRGVWLVCGLIVSSGASASLAAQRPARTLPEFERQLSNLRTQLHIPGMTAAIAVGQQIVWSQGFGFADVAAGIPASDSTVYHLASLTKTYASTILLQLVEQGRLDLDAPVTDFGITLTSPGVVRVRHLFSHTSDGDPGAAFRYNGDRYALLGQVIRQAAGQNFAALLQQRILAPLALRFTAPNPQVAGAFAVTGLDRATFLGNLAQGYDSEGRRPIDYPGLFSPAAGMVASAPDVARYSMALDDTTLLQPATRALAFTPAISTAGDTLPYGLGWFTTSQGGIPVIWHYGYWTGNSSIIIKVPSRGLTFVLLANSDALSRGTRLGAGDLMSSRAARLFVNAFVTGTATLP